MVGKSLRVSAYQSSHQNSICSLMKESFCYIPCLIVQIIFFKSMLCLAGPLIFKSWYLNDFKVETHCLVHKTSLLSPGLTHIFVSCLVPIGI